MHYSLQYQYAIRQLLEQSQVTLNEKSENEFESLCVY